MNSTILLKNLSIKSELVQFFICHESNSFEQAV